LEADRSARDTRDYHEFTPNQAATKLGKREESRRQVPPLPCPDDTALGLRPWKRWLPPMVSKHMDHTGSSGDLIPFRPVVLDGDTCTLVRLPAGTSERARGFRAQADAPATVRAYAADWRHFLAWCGDQGRQPFGSDEALEPIVGEYLSSIGPTQAMSTLRRRVAAIVRQARLAQVPFDTGNPHVRETLRGIARKHTGDKRQAAALTTPEIRKLVLACGPGLAGLRDRALILIGFAGALRRSELVALQHKHVVWTARGISLRIARSKTSPTGVDIGIGGPVAREPKVHFSMACHANLLISKRQCRKPTFDASCRYPSDSLPCSWFRRA
jgi:hypothetical protein